MQFNRLFTVAAALLLAAGHARAGIEVLQPDEACSQDTFVYEFLPTTP
ncbi:hypothetical protein [Thiohalocapsa sp.]|nr:hypothetical protein [Thiohalocapsa sp.]